jgi:hypothetical protein
MISKSEIVNDACAATALFTILALSNVAPTRPGGGRFSAPNEMWRAIWRDIPAAGF